MSRGHLSEAFLKAVGKYMLVETKLAVADVCVVFGNPHCDHLARHAVKLYHDGYAKTFVVTGAPKTDDGRTEADRMRDIMVGLGVPAACILVEDKSYNSGENVVNTIELLKEKGLYDDIKSLIAVGHIQASRRFLMTLERHWPQPLKMFTTENVFPVSRDEWYKDDQFRTLVLKEFDKLPRYAIKGFVAEVDVVAINENAAKLPQPEKKND